MHNELSLTVVESYAILGLVHYGLTVRLSNYKTI